MKRTFIFYYAFIMLMIAFPALAQEMKGFPFDKGQAAPKEIAYTVKNNHLLQAIQSDVSHTSRKVYGIGMYNKDWANGYNYGIGSLYTDNPSAMNLDVVFNYPVFAAAAANDVYYAYFYEFDAFAGALPLGFCSVNLLTGEVIEIVNWRGKNEMPKFQDMAYDYSTNTMYALGYESRSYLYSIDLTTGELIKGVEIKGVGGNRALAASYDGQLYVIDREGTLNKLNKTDGTVTEVCKTEFPPLNFCSMEFDHTDGTLYWSTYSSEDGSGKSKSMRSHLVRFDLANKTYQDLGRVGGETTKMYGMYIPFLRSGFSAPGAPTDIKVVTGEKGAEKVTVSWKNPAKTYGGENLTEITSVTIMRDGVELKTFTGVNTGQEMSWEDNTVKSGQHRYAIYATSNVGKGDRGFAEKYVGIDIPSVVGNVKVEVSEACKSATLTWEAPTKGAHDGYFDNASLSYTIVRYPDSVVVADNLKALTFADMSVKRLGGYYYGIAASNVSGKSKETTTSSCVIGKALDLPYSCEFLDLNKTANEWTAVDGNADGYTWVIQSGFGLMIFGDALPATEYIADPNYVTSDADEWLISPPLNLEKNKRYKLSFDARSSGMDNVSVSIGNGNTVKAQTRSLKAFELVGEMGNVPFETQEFLLPDDLETGIYCIGFHLTTPFAESIMFQLSNVNVYEAPNSIHDDKNDPDMRISHMAGKLSISGEFEKAEVYNTTGVNVGHMYHDNPSLDTNNWASGVYFVKVTRGNTSKVYKTIVR